MIYKINRQDGGVSILRLMGHNTLEKVLSDWATINGDPVSYEEIQESDIPAIRASRSE